jgi:alkylation response protein AidB-like acyl-CoA dehydrogenase
LGRGVSLDLAFDDGQQAIADAVASFCADHCDDDVVKAAAGTLPRELWLALAELGVLGVLTPDGGGGALEAMAAVESLGRAVFPGPLVSTFLATWLLEDPVRADVSSGRALVSAGTPPLLPWVSEADVVLEIDGERVFLAHPLGDALPVETLGAEPWGRVALDRDAELRKGPSGLVLCRMLLAAQLVAMGERLVADASRHAAVRKQFGRPIGDFQAVAHPLADCSMRLAAARTLARAAAFQFDDCEGSEEGAEEGDGDGSAVARRYAAAAHLSACEASLEAAHVCHQVFGAIGITLEGPVFHVSRRIRQLASQAPSRDSSRVLLLAHAGFGGEARMGGTA